jgi:hypothetical protein
MRVSAPHAATILILASASLATAAALPSAWKVCQQGGSSKHVQLLTLVTRVLTFKMKGRMTARTSNKNKTTDAVTKVRDQFLVKATMRAAMMVALYSTKMPSFSEIPSCRTLAVEVMVLVA